MQNRNQMMPPSYMLGAMGGYPGQMQQGQRGYPGQMMGAGGGYHPNQQQQPPMFG